MYGWGEISDGLERGALARVIGRHFVAPRFGQGVKLRRVDCSLRDLANILGRLGPQLAVILLSTGGTHTVAELCLRVLRDV